MEKTSKTSDSDASSATGAKTSGGKTSKTSGSIKEGKSSAAVKSSNGKGNGNGNGDCGNGKLRCKSLIVDGTKYRTQLNKKFENRKLWEPHNPKKITSLIPGTIIKIDVKVGQTVSEGEQILILEAMKMKNKILFGMDGTVKSIHVKEGEKIPKDFLMLEMK